MNLHDYDIVIINSSAGKDSAATIWEIARMAWEQNYPYNKIHVSHQDLGEMEWQGTTEMAMEQANFFGFHFHVSKRRDKNGYEETLLEYVERRGKWPSSKQRYCTSDFKRAPGARVVTGLTKGMGECNVLHCYGFRAEESPSRSKKEPFAYNARLSTKKRAVYDYLPIHHWTSDNVWNCINNTDIPYHYAYDHGMPRLSCVFCIFSPFDALVLAGKKNPALLQRYVDTERKIGHQFRQDFAIEDVQKAIANGYEPENIQDWRM